MLRKWNKFYLLTAAEIICLLLLLPGCFRENKLIYDFWGKDITEMVIPLGDHAEFSGDFLELQPGVYQIEVLADLAEGQSLGVELKSETAYHNSLLSNQVPIFSGDDSMTFSVWALDRIQSAHVQCFFYNTSPESLVQLKVYWTSKGSQMLWFLVLVLFGLLDMLIAYRRRILTGAVSKRQQIVFWALTAAVLIAYFPYLTDYFSIGADTLFHLTRIAGLKDTLEQGASFPIRIQSYWNYGHGYAVSMFYGDLFLFFPAGLMMIGFPIMAAYKLFIFVLLAVTAIIAYHSFYQCSKDEYAALFGSMVYLLVPYRFLNIYNRGALGECLSMAFLPLVCCGMYLLYTEDINSSSYKRYKWYIIWGISAVLQSHLISTEMAVVFMTVFCILFWKKTFRKETFGQLFEAAVIALLINMWFWLPMIYMMNADIYHLQSITRETVQDRGVYLAGILQLLPNRGWAQTGMYNCEPVQIGAGALMLLIIYIVWLGWRRRDSWNKAGKILAAFSILTIVMSLRYLPWDAAMKIPGLGYIVSSLQFPSRWMVLATLFVSMFAVFFFQEVRTKGGYLVKAALGVAALLTVGSALYQANSLAFESGATFLYEPNNMGSISVGNGEYLLEEVGAFALDLYYHDPVADTGLEWSDYEKKGTNAVISLDNLNDHPSFIEIPLMGYKGYHVQDVGEEYVGPENPSIVEETGNHGDLRIVVPAGYQGTISISYRGFPIFRMSEVISLISSAVVIGVYFYYKWKESGNGIEVETR